MRQATKTVKPVKKEVALKKLRAMKAQVFERYGITLLGLFGSVARNEHLAGSDLDILIKLEPGASIMDWSALRLDLMDAFDCEVDLIDSENIREDYKPFIFKDFIPL